jgi:hypothetical protein
MLYVTAGLQAAVGSECPPAGIVAEHTRMALPQLSKAQC